MANTPLPPLPSGYSLDQAPAQLPPLPVGYSLDGATSSTPTEAQAVAQAPNLVQQAHAMAASIPMQASTLGGIYHALSQGSTPANRASVAQTINRNVQQSQEDAQNGDITTAGVGQGFVKGAAQTAHSIGRVANAATGDNVPGLPTSFQEPESLQTSDTSENLGKGAEGVLEFIAGDAALKGLPWTQKFQKLQKVAQLFEEHESLAKLTNIGLLALRQGAVGAAQTVAHGGSAQDAAITGAVTGATGGLLEGAGEGLKAAKNFITRNPEIDALGQKIVEGLTGGDSPKQVAETVGKNLADAEEAMHTAYDTGLKKISAQGQGVPVAIKGSALQQTATDLLSDSRLPESVATGLKGVIPDSDKIEPFLTQLSSSNEVLSWDQMEATRQKIGQTIRKLPWDSPIRPDLIKLRYAIDDTLQGAAEKAGNADLSDQIKTLRSGYAQTNAALEERAIVALKDKSPNAVADVLLNKQSVHNVDTLRRLIGPENMKAVEGSVLDKLIQDASKNGELQGRQLFRAFTKLGPDAKQALWGDRLPQIDYFMQQANKLPNVVLDKIVSHYAPYAGVGGSALFGGYEGATHGYEHGGLTGAVTGAVGGTVGGAALGLGVSSLSKLLRNPYVLDAAIKSIAAVSKTVPPVAAQAAQQINPPQTAGDIAEPTHVLRDGKIVPLN